MKQLCDADSMQVGVLVWL